MARLVPKPTDPAASSAVAVWRSMEPFARAPAADANGAASPAAKLESPYVVVLHRRWPTAPGDLPATERNQRLADVKISAPALTFG
jgi:hypothetical protein